MVGYGDDRHLGGGAAVDTQKVAGEGTVVGGHHRQTGAQLSPHRAADGVVVNDVGSPLFGRLVAVHRLGQLRGRAHLGGAHTGGIGPGPLDRAGTVPGGVEQYVVSRSGEPAAEIVQHRFSAAITRRRNRKPRRRDNRDTQLRLPGNPIIDGRPLGRGCRLVRRWAPLVWQVAYKSAPGPIDTPSPPVVEQSRLLPVRGWYLPTSAPRFNLL